MTKSDPNLIISLFVFKMKEIPAEDDPRKQFEAAKVAMGDRHCDDVDSNRELRRVLNLSQRKYRDAIQAMREGRDVGVNGRPPYMHDAEKTDFWNWVKAEAQTGHRPTMNEMRRYATSIMIMKRPGVMKKRGMVSARHIKTLLTEGEIALDSCVRRPTEKLISEEEMKEFFRRVQETIQQYAIDRRVIVNMREINVSLTDSSETRCTLIACVSASGQRLPSAYVIPPQKDLASLVRQGNVFPSDYIQSKKGRVTSACILTWIRNNLIPWVDARRKDFGLKDALLVVDEKEKFSKTALRLLESHQIHLVSIPSNGTSLLQPLDAGLYGSYMYLLKLKWTSNDIAGMIKVSEIAVSDAFTMGYIVDAWDETTMLSERHYSVLRRLRKDERSS